MVVYLDEIVFVVCHLIFTRRSLWGVGWVERRLKAALETALSGGPFTNMFTFPAFRCMSV
jgi:hypothetical protein